MNLVGMLASAALGGLLLQWSGLSGGVIIGSMVGAAAWSLASGGAEITIPKPFQTTALIVLGAVIGAGITRETVRQTSHYLGPALLAATLIILAGIGVTLLLRTLGIAPPEDLLATSPGALSAVIGVAADRGEGATAVGVFHTVRVLVVLVTLPALAALIPRGG